jgi:hypothetical protein
MKVKNGDVFQSTEPLATLLKLPWPVSTSYALAKMANKLSEQFNIVEEVRQGLVRKYGTEKNGETTVDPSNMEKFRAEYDELMNQEVELVITGKVVLPSDTDGMTIEPIVLMALEQFVEVV